MAADGDASRLGFGRRLVRIVNQDAKRQRVVCLRQLIVGGGGLVDLDDAIDQRLDVDLTL